MHPRRRRRRRRRHRKEFVMVGDKAQDQQRRVRESRAVSADARADDDGSVVRMDTGQSASWFGPLPAAPGAPVDADVVARLAATVEELRQRLDAHEGASEPEGLSRQPLDPPMQELFTVAPVVLLKPWDASVYNDSGTWKVTFYRCFIKRSGLCSLISVWQDETQTFALPTDLATGSYYIGVRVTLEDNTVTLLSGANLSDVAYVTPPSGSDQDYGRIPLYVLAYVSGDSPTWRVRYDLRSIPDLGVYI